jgi:VIT1/CCC1 family predicted Fe2+/Mn2+ transporter
MTALELLGPDPEHAGAIVHPGDGIAGAREAAILHEVLMGAQDNLTNVLAIMLGVSVGAGRADLVALAGASAAVAEAVSMGGVLYSATRAARLTRGPGREDVPGQLSPMGSGIVTFAAALVAGIVPLIPFAVVPLAAAVACSVAISLVALFALGSWTGRIGGAVWWRDGVRMLIVGAIAAVAAAAVGSLMRVA